MTEQEIAEVLGKARRWIELAEQLPAVARSDQAVMARALIALAERVKAREWQPIETAPKDGSEILAYAWARYRSYYGVAQWAEANPAFSNSVAGWFWPFAIRPTHWQPLPEGPKP